MNIIFSLLSFTKQEQKDLVEKRKGIKTFSLSLNKSVKSDEQSSEKELKISLQKSIEKEMKKGLLSLFTRNKSPTNNTINAPSPVKKM